MHRNVAISDYRSPVTSHRNIRMDICQIGYDICEFDSLRGLGIVIIGSLHFDNEIDLLYGWAVLERRPNHVKRVVADIWLLTVSWTLTWEMIRTRNLYCFVYRQHTWLRKWKVIVGGHDRSCWDLWILGGRGFVGVQRRSCIVVGCMCRLVYIAFECISRRFYIVFGCMCRLVYIIFGCMCRLVYIVFRCMSCMSRLVYIVFGCMSRLYLGVCGLYCIWVYV